MLLTNAMLSGESILNKTLFTWGATNSNGQLGIGTTIINQFPQQIGGLSWSSVSSGTSYKIAIRADGTLWAWGANSWGQLGNNDSLITTASEAHSGPWYDISVANVAPNLVIAIGSNDRALWTWGLNTFYQLGDGTSTNRISPVKISSTGESWTKIAAGNFHGLAIRLDGSLWAWGDNASGQVGDGTTSIKSFIAKIGASSWSQISSSSNSSFGITIDGRLFAWGNNNVGQLGTGDTINKSSPVQIGTTLSWSKVSSSQSHALAIATDGSLYAWGLNSLGQLGDGTTIDRLVPTKVLNSVSTSSWSAVSAGSNFTIAISANGKVLHAWGNNNAGQLGDTTAINKSSPVVISTLTGASDVFSEVSAGESHASAVGYDGTAFRGVFYTWGYNATCALGDSTQVNKSTPSIISAGTPGSEIFGSLRSASKFTYFIGTSGKIYSWGLLTDERLLGRFPSKSSPIQIGTSSWLQVSASANGSVAAIRSDGKLFTWGVNSSGQLGDGSTTHRSSPVLVATTSSWSFVSSGGISTSAIQLDGSLWSTGLGTQLGNNTATNRSTFAKIGTLSWSQINVGPSHVMGITTNNMLYAWGGNANGQLGDGTNVSKSSPVPIGASSWSKISAGFNWSMAIDANGRLFTWGGGGDVLGDNSATGANRSSPVQIGTSSWSQVFAYIQESMAIDTTGRLFTWGTNAFGGALGDASVGSRGSPVQVGNAYTWEKISYGSGITK